MASSNAEDEDLKKAIAMSMIDARKEADASLDTPNGEETFSSEGKVSQSMSQQSAGVSLLGLNRKAMEEERLARNGRKRKQERLISPPPRKAPKLESSTVSLPSGAKLTSFSSMIDQNQQGRKPETANTANKQLKQSPVSKLKQEPQDDPPSSTPLPQGSMRYPNGVVLKTWAFGFGRERDTKLEEVLEPQSVRTAVLSAFQWDVDWVMSKLKVPPNGGTKCVFIMQADTDELRQRMLRESEHMRPFLRICFPPMYQPIHCMHSKLMLLFHPNKLRVAIPTANLLNFDWGETGVMENSVFIIDLPRLSEEGKSSLEGVTAFSKEMFYYLEKQGLDKDVLNGVRNFDFAATKDMAFVHTAGGVCYGKNAERTGLPGLAQAVRRLGLHSDEGLQVDFAASSIGSLNDDYLRSVYAAARGDDMIARADGATSKAKADFFKSSAEKGPSDGTGIREKIRIYFPTQETVKASKAGAVGTICLSREWFEGAKFPRSCFRDYHSTRTGLLSHNKILYARGKQKGENGTAKDVAWAYVGSSNMSESAWGKLSYDKTERAWKIICRNWECGVLLPVRLNTLDSRVNDEVQPESNGKTEGEDSETESEDEGDGAAGTSSNASDLVDISVFDDIVKPPFEIPGATYNGRQPWYFKETA